MRIINRLFGLVLGLALFGAGGFLALETILAAVGDRFVVIPGKGWLSVLRRTAWASNTATLVLSLVAAGGFLLLILELRRWRRSRTPVAVAGAVGEWWLVRRSVEGYLARRLAADTHADRVRCRLTHRGRTLQVRVTVRETAQLTPAVGGAGHLSDGSALQAFSGRAEEVVLASLSRVGALASSRVRVRTLRARKLRAGQVVAAPGGAVAGVAPAAAQTAAEQATSGSVVGEQAVKSGEQATSGSVVGEQVVKSDEQVVKSDEQVVESGEQVVT